MPVIFLHRTRVSNEYTLLTHIGVWVNKLIFSIHDANLTPLPNLPVLPQTEISLKRYIRKYSRLLPCRERIRVSVGLSYLSPSLSDLGNF